MILDHPKEQGGTIWFVEWKKGAGSHQMALQEGMSAEEEHIHGLRFVCVSNCCRKGIFVDWKMFFLEKLHSIIITKDKCYSIIE